MICTVVSSVTARFAIAFISYGMPSTRFMSSGPSSRRFRIAPQTRRRPQGLDHEFPDDIPGEPEPVSVESPATPLPKPDPAKATIEGWKPRRLQGGEWGAALSGPNLAGLPDDGHLPGTPIRR